MNTIHGRRDFLRTATATAAAVLAARAGWAAPHEKPKLRKAVKYDMVADKNAKTNKEKLALVKKCGFEGVEINSPSDLDLDDLVAAAKETGITIHGVIDSKHWNKPFSSPDEAVRAQGFDALKIALNDAAKVGATTVLVVPGVVNKEATFEQCWERSQAEIRKALPLAAKLKVHIAIEVVWNNFITKPEQLVKYVDEFQSHWLGAYFDCSNMIKYGVSDADWIRKMGKRMLKFDFKGYSVAKAKEAKDEWKGFNVGIGEGDEDWPAIMKACAEVGYNGWFTAEVKSGDEAWLKDVSARMDKILQNS
jgi:hexulose-6-phosphate isomerase